MIAEFGDIQRFAENCFETAKTAAGDIQFSVLESKAHYSKQASELRERATSIADEPEYAQLDTAYGMAAWSVILSVDMRDSSGRAVRVKAKNTYLTMHTYLPTMAELVRRAQGKIVGLRGDGLFAAFGLTKLVGTGSEVSSETAGRAVQGATRCGKAMLEATADIVNPILERNDIEAGLRIGVGISVGDVVVTRIGLRDANELTAYGPPVNQACKLCSRTTEIMLTTGAEAIFPTSKGGKVKFNQITGGFIVRYPPDVLMLRRGQNRISRPRPR